MSPFRCCTNPLFKQERAADPIQSHVVHAIANVPRKEGERRKGGRERRSERDLAADKAEFLITGMVPNTHIESRGRSLEMRGKERVREERETDIIHVQKERRTN